MRNFLATGIKNPVDIGKLERSRVIEIEIEKEDRMGGEEIIHELQKM